MGCLLRAAVRPGDAIDWIRFGQLLRERLGWEDYPHVPGA